MLLTIMMMIMMMTIVRLLFVRMMDDGVMFILLLIFKQFKLASDMSNSTKISTNSKMTLLPIFFTQIDSQNIIIPENAPISGIFRGELLLRIQEPESATLDDEIPKIPPPTM